MCMKSHFKLKFLSHLFQNEFKSASVWSNAGLSSKATVFLPSLLNRTFPQESLTVFFRSYCSAGSCRLSGSSGPASVPRLPFAISHDLPHLDSCCHLFIPLFILPKTFLHGQYVFLEIKISQTI